VVDIDLTQDEVLARVVIVPDDHLIDARLDQPNVHDAVLDLLRRQNSFGGDVSSSFVQAVDLIHDRVQVSER
jgi:hypothetical protein